MFLIPRGSTGRLWAWAVICPVLILALSSAGCAKKVIDGYGPGHGTGNGAGIRDRNPDAGTHGVVDVVCRPGFNRDRGLPDTLFGCLLDARETGRGTVRLPSGVYLGHVSQFIVRSLRFYDFEDHFERYYGYRLVLRIRRAGPDEAEAAQHGRYARLAMGTAGEMTAMAVTPLYLPLTPILFLVDSARAEARRKQFAANAQDAGLPEPDIGGVEVAWKDYGRRYAAVLGMDDGREVMDAYVVEECYLENPSGGEVMELAAAPRKAGGRP